MPRQSTPPPGRFDVPATQPGQARTFGLVALGGAVGTGLRVVVAELGLEWDGISVAVPVVNLVGAFAMGAFLVLLQRRHALDSAARRRRLLLLGTGLIGGFTTYSGLAMDAVVLLSERTVVAGIAYPVVTVLGGALAAWAGIAMAQRLQRVALRRCKS